MPSSRIILVALLCAGSIPALSVCARAEPLDKDSCRQLQDEKKALLTPNMQSALDHGPDWVKDNLDPVALDKVRRFLMVEEKIVFRCRNGGVDRPKSTDDGIPFPDRNPSRPPQIQAEAKPSQTVADSDKTATGRAKATQ
jgi:hypothetical protein